MTENQRPLRDKKGQFVKGHEPLIRPTYVYMKHFPKLYCNTCYKGAACPDYQEGFVCAYKKGLRKYGTRSIEEVLDAMFDEFDARYVNSQHRAIVEKVTGDYDEVLTKAISKSIRLGILIVELSIQQRKSRSLNSPISKDTLEQFLEPKHPENDTDLPCTHK